MKPERIAVWPARAGMNLAHPQGGPLPDTGKRWPNDTFTHRRVADGGIVLEKPEWLTAPEAPAAAPADEAPDAA